MEKKLKVKLAGYQSIGQHLIKLIEEVGAELEACKREKATFELLEKNEEKAIRKRLNKLVEEVTQQLLRIIHVENNNSFLWDFLEDADHSAIGCKEKREKELQKRYDELMQEKWNIGQALVRMDATITAQPIAYQ
ncbi:Cell division cycle 5-like protein [Dirofilaria immitis]|nr:Cell division cycle 5-like protein [Dirofilaria immitis]